MGSLASELKYGQLWRQANLTTQSARSGMTSNRLFSARATIRRVVFPSSTLDNLRMPTAPGAGTLDEASALSVVRAHLRRRNNFIRRLGKRPPRPSQEIESLFDAWWSSEACESKDENSGDSSWGK
ncbi:unnamed protein product [Protopolystoma xenopodis]|uniref:Uncharacterized protein n=1 Tax=Protopolystoma xenopodis TaxID=117903 RepID=A0A3S5CEH5_9PLAT|nr:unnamed protein product [Protopolystoma xenopodis]